MSGFCYLCLCVTAVCALIATKPSHTFGRSVSKKVHHKGSDFSRKRHTAEENAPFYYAEGEIPLLPPQGKTPFLLAQREISWYSCGDRHCRCKGSRADCSHQYLRYLPQLKPSITILDFSLNNISNISEDFFMNVTSLTELHLCFNKLRIQFISPDAFRNLTNLTHLDITGTFLSTDAASTVFNIPTLEKLRIELSMQCDKIEEIKLKHSMPRLHELNIGYNWIETFNLAWLSFFPGLTVLKIAGPYTKLANHQSLHTLSKLTYLDMTSTFQSCEALRTDLTIPFLEVLILREVKDCLDFPDIDIKTAVPRLQELDLRRGSSDFMTLKHLNLTRLAPFTGLRRLHLSGIDIFEEEHTFHRVITDYHALHRLHNLTYLDLSNNAASCRDLTSILTIPSLQELIMSDSTVCTRYDGNISLSLVKVDLSHNGLTHVNFHQPHEAGNFSSLKVLTLKKNQLELFTPQTCRTNSSISMFPFLETLDMSDNSLSEFKKSRISGSVCLPHVRSIDLRHNGVRFTSSSFAEDIFGCLETLDVSDQREVGIYRTIKKDVFRNAHLKTLILNNDGILFNNPDYVDADCFSGCLNLTHLSLGDNEFKGVSEERFHQLFGSLVHLTELSLSSTGISFVTVGMFQGLKSLQKLDLRKNSLVILPDDVFQLLPKLKLVNISFNKISVVRESMFSFTTRLRLQHVDLSENPFDCSCQVLWFQKWLLTNPSIFADSSSHYTCGNLPSTTVQSFFMQKQACLLSPETSKFIIATASVIFIGVSLLSFLHRYRWHIRLVLFEAFRGPGDRLRRLREHRFEYDVFVSYDSEDFPWVRDHLMPNLERRMGLKLCIHQRDFIPGCPIVENIMGCLNSSKKMLMLFSKAFVESQWCQFELQLCLSHAMDTEDALIVVILEDIPSHDLTPAMMAVMKTTTYIEWADDADAVDSFWRRMRLALNEVLQND